MVRQDLIDERFLPFKSFHGTAGRKIVILVQAGIRNLRKVLKDCQHAMMGPAIPAVPGLSQYELSSIRCVPQIKPISTVLEEWRMDNLKPGCPCVHAGDKNVHFTLGFSVHIFRRGLPM